jgi:site-specific recombinase XerD
MDAVYLFFEKENIKIPFYNFDKSLFNRLVKSNMGHWEQSEKQYKIARSKYNHDQMKNVLFGKPFVEVGKEADYSIDTYNFITGEKPAPEKMIRAETCKEAPETYRVSQAQGQESGLPDQFPGNYIAMLETEMRSRKFSQHTRTAYISHNKALCKWLQKPPEDVTSYDIKRYLAYLEQAKQYAAATLNSTLSAFKFFYNDVLKRDTAQDQRRPRQDKRLPVVLSKAEIRKMFDAERNEKHRLILMMVYASGLRVSEVVKLKRQDMDFDRKTILIVGGKGRKDRSTIMSDTVYHELKEYYIQNKITDWLFTGADPSQHLTIRTAQHICKKALKKAKIEKKASIHSLRHTFATHLLENGYDITHIGKLLGHASIITTARYTHVAKRKTLSVTSPLDMINKPDEE